MNIDTRLVFPYEDVPKNGTMLEIENNVRWIRMPLPMSLNHINLWLKKKSLIKVDLNVF